jgi:hypothetical protein
MCAGRTWSRSADRCWGGWMPTRERKRQSRVATVERDILDAAIDVCVEDWRRTASASAASVVGQGAWGEVTKGWGIGSCCGLSTVADTIGILSGEPHQLVEWIVAAALQAHGVPPFIARVIGRLVANWLLTPLDPFGKAATRLRVLGVLLCAEDGDLGNCPCLERLGQDLTIDLLKRELAEDLDIAPQAGGPSAPRAEPPHFATTRGHARARDQHGFGTMPGPKAQPGSGRAAPHGPETPRPSSPAAPSPREKQPPGPSEPQPPPGPEPPRPSGHEPTGPRAPEPPGPSGPEPPGQWDQEPPGPSGPEPPGQWDQEPPGPSGPEPPEPTDDPDPRLRAACDAVRGAGRVPSIAVFGAGSDLP